jgi:DNA-binding NarL/FixJ family response regulator
MVETTVSDAGTGGPPLAERCELPFEIALCRLARAEAHLADGHRAAADALLDEAEATLTRLEAAPTLARLAALQNRPAPAPKIAGGLTTREIEVLGLVARGLTDAEIGERLFISAATASKHLRAIYGKLNLHTRAAVTRYAIERGLA